jgi:hypothetical protein
VSNINIVRRPGIASRLWRVCGFLLIVLTTAAVHAQSRDAANRALAAFEAKTQDYALMHRRLERRVGTIEFGTTVPEINRMIQELAAAIRAERRDAQQGDFFTPVIARELRMRVNAALLANGFTVADVRAASRVDRIDYQRINLTVNDTFPWILGVAMFPCVTSALPRLPAELQYRIVDDALFLIDVHAGLIVDILPWAVVDLTAAGPRNFSGDGENPPPPALSHR